jgi:hypothetical protein
MPYPVGLFQEEEMRDSLPENFERGRIREGHFASSESDGCMGAFEVQGPSGAKLRVISSGGQDEWEHVSVSTSHRTPNWREMCFVKDAFWREDECVIQYHPPKRDYVNIHPNCLHLWRPMDRDILMPPLEML